MSEERYAEHTVAWELPNGDSVTKSNYNLADIETKYLPIQTEVVSDNKDQTINQQDQRIAELEEQLKNAIVPKFETYQSIFYITQYYTSTKGNPEYDIISDKYYVAENENEIILGWNYMKDFNQRKYYYVRKDWVFATKEEAQAKLEELKGENK